MSVLIKDYPLSVGERKPGLLATGWKSRYQEGSVIRERLSAQITGARNESELRFYLQTEILSNGARCEIGCPRFGLVASDTAENRRLDMLAEELNQALVRRYLIPSQVRTRVAGSL